MSQVAKTRILLLMGSNSVSQAGCAAKDVRPLTLPATAELGSAGTAEGGRRSANLGQARRPSLHRRLSIVFCLLFASFGAWSDRRCLGVMTDIGSENPENDVLGNVGGVVRDAFEITCHQECI